MAAVFAECRKLREEYYKSRERQVSDYHFTRDDGERILKLRAYEKLQEECDEYYQICVEERSYRTPRPDWEKINDKPTDSGAVESVYKKRKADIIRKV